MIKNILENQNRHAVFDHIQNNPGCTIAEISDQQKINRGSVKYHIYKLESEGKIILTKMGKFSRLFQNSETFKDNGQVIAIHLKNKTSRLLLWTIFENPGITNQELTEKFHIAKSTAHWYIQQLSKDKLIVSKQEGKYRRYSINADVEMILLKFMPPDKLSMFKNKMLVFMSTDLLQ